MTEPAKDEAELLRRIEDQSGWDGQWLIAPVDALAAIRAAGWVVVPVEPTEEMLDAFSEQLLAGLGKHTGRLAYPAGDKAMSTLEILALCMDPKSLAIMLIEERDNLRAENARLREALEDLLDDTWVGDFGEWFEARLKQAQTALTREDNHT